MGDKTLILIRLLGDKEDKELETMNRDDPHKFLLIKEREYTVRKVFFSSSFSKIIELIVGLCVYRVSL